MSIQIVKLFNINDNKMLNINNDNKHKNHTKKN